jgi:hypothetical protein
MKPMNGTTHKDAMKMLQGMKLPEGLKAPGGTPPQDTMKTPQRMKHPGDAKTLGGTKSGQPRRGE